MKADQEMFEYVLQFCEQMKTELRDRGEKITCLSAEVQRLVGGLPA